MDSPWYVELINKLPDNVAAFITNKVVNRFISKYADMNVEGMENVENLKEPVIFISNHLSNSDGVILNKILKKQDVTFVAGVKLSHNKFTKLGKYVVEKTINIKPNSADKDAMASIIKTVKDGNNVMIFPEGTRSRNGEMMEAKRGVLLIQKLTKAKIVPIGICGTENLLPIDDSGMEKEKFQNAKVNVKIGKPIDIIPKTKEEDRHEYEDRTMKYVMKSVADLLPEKYRGVYKE